LQRRPPDLIGSSALSIQEGQSVTTSQNIELEPLLKPTDLIELLQVSRGEAYHLLASGEIPSLKIGRLRRVRRQDLDEWLNRRAEVA
jgi:excisionase family DNA binding protein